MIFDKKELKKFRNQTPFFVFSKDTLLKNLEEYEVCLPKKTEICYAMKANSEKVVLKTLNEAGVSFEVASKYELALLREIKVDPARIVYGTSVKPESHIKEFVKYGVDRFAFDSEEELLRIGKLAPKSRVYVRTLVNDESDSIFTMSEKFGTNLDNAVSLLVKAREIGLIPYGISFNVGSQARNAQAWANGIRDIARAMKKLLAHGIKIQVINMGGGFPYDYQGDNVFPNIQNIAKSIEVVNKKLPYPIKYIAEPGRGIVADAFLLVTSVIGKSKRENGHWLFIDAGVYNALLEATKFQGKTRYKIDMLSDSRASNSQKAYILTGPTGDNIDVVSSKVILPADIKVGDKLLISDVGAYTFPLTTRFNGFPKPRIVQLQSD